jgi:hypothetical protein
VRFSQRWPSVFLTCSADWSLNLYHLKFKGPMLSMRATGENFPINDISWCPDNSTVSSDLFLCDYGNVMGPTENFQQITFS